MLGGTRLRKIIIENVTTPLKFLRNNAWTDAHANLEPIILRCNWCWGWCRVDVGAEFSNLLCHIPYKIYWYVDKRKLYLLEFEISISPNVVSDWFCTEEWVQDDWGWRDCCVLLPGAPGLWGQLGPGLSTTT